MTEPRAVIDLGTRSLALLLWRHGEEGGRPEILAGVRTFHPGRPVIDGIVLDVPEAGRALEAALAELDRTGAERPRAAAIAVASREMTVRKGRASWEGEGEITPEIETRILGEAVAEAAVSLADPGEFLLVDRAVLSRARGAAQVASLVGQAGPAVVEVAATFVPRRVLEAKAAVLARAGIAVEGICLEPRAALAAAAGPLPRGARVAVVDIGAGTTDLALAEGAPDGTPRAVALDSMPVAGDEVSDRIGEKLGIPFAEAEERKREKNPAPPLAAVLAEAIREHAEEIARRIRAMNGTSPLAEVLLVGGGSLLLGLSEAVGRSLSAEGLAAVVRLGQVREKDFTAPVWATPVGILRLAAEGNLLRLDRLCLDGREKTLAFPPELLGWPEVFASFGRDLADLDAAPGRSLFVRLVEEGNVRTVLLPGARGETYTDARFRGGETLATLVGADGADRTAHLADLPRKSREFQVDTFHVAVPWAYRRDGEVLAESSPVLDGDRLEGAPPGEEALRAALAARTPAPRVLFGGTVREIAPPARLHAVSDSVYRYETRPVLVADLLSALAVPPRATPGGILEISAAGKKLSWDEPLPSGLVEAAWR